MQAFSFQAECQRSVSTRPMRSSSRTARPGGRYQRVGRGLYRLRYYPSSAHEHVVRAWLALRGAGAVVSPDRTLELYDLADVIPDVVHLSVPRSQRGQRPRPGIRLHNLLRPLAPDETRPVAGVVARFRDLVVGALGGPAPRPTGGARRESTPFDVRECWCPGSCRVRDVPILRALAGAMRVTVRRSPRLNSRGKRSTPERSSCLDALRGGQAHPTRPAR
jgi:hypothetical protein